MRSSQRLLRQFLNVSSIHGLKLLLLFVKWRYAKKLWILFMLLIIIYTHYIIVNLTIEYIRSPTEIHMATNLVHVANSPFVAVAICSANKISRRKLKPFAEKVFVHQQGYRPALLARTAPQMEDFLLLLAGLYVYPYDSYRLDDERLSKLHEILTHMYNKTDYPTREILRELAPDCEDIVLRGLIFGEIVNTSKLINKRMTSTSVCCMFNYKRESYAIDPNVRARDNEHATQTDYIVFESNSILNSVQFVLQDDPDDYSYKSMSNDAFQIFLFPPDDYPTIQSDVTGQILVNHNSIVEIPVQPTFFSSSHSIRQFHPSVRKCYFPEEGQKLIKQSYYSQDECLLICRMYSMLNYCGCVNPSFPAYILNASYCSLMDLPCLTEWKKIWYNWNYFDYVTSDREQLQEPSHATLDGTSNCYQCYPTCNGVDFKIYINNLPLDRPQNGLKHKHGLLQNISHVKPLAIIKLYFKQRNALATVEDITDDWVVLLSRFGGIMSLMFGFSIVSYMEILYYLTGKWFLYIYQNITSKTVTPRENAAMEVEATEESLYWNELKPSHLKNTVILHSYKNFNFN